MNTTPNTPDAADAKAARELAERTGTPVTLTTSGDAILTETPAPEVEVTPGPDGGATITPITEAKTSRRGKVIPAKTGNPREDRAAEREAAKAAKAKLEAALGTEPGNAKDRARFESVNKTAQRQLRKDAMALMEAGATKAKAWAGALDDAGIMAAEPAPKPAKATTTRAPRPHAGVAVDGYTVRWPHPAYDLLLTTDKTAERDAWLCRCNEHGKTTPVASGKDGDAKGRAAERATWCSGCKRAAAKAAETTTAPAAETTTAPAAE